MNPAQKLIATLKKITARYGELTDDTIRQARKDDPTVRTIIPAKRGRPPKHINITVRRVV